MFLCCDDITPNLHFPLEQQIKVILTPTFLACARLKSALTLLGLSSKALVQSVSAFVGYKKNRYMSIQYYCITEKLLANYSRHKEHFSSVLSGRGRPQQSTPIA